MRGPNHGVIHSFLHRNALTRNRRFVNACHPFKHNAVNWDHLTRFDNNALPGAHIFERHAHLFAITKNSRALWRQSHQSGHRFGGALLSAGFKVFTERHQRDDHPGAFEVEPMRVVVHRHRLPICTRQVHHKERPDAVNERGACTNRDECVHRRGTMPERLKPTNKRDTANKENRD